MGIMTGPFGPHGSHIFSTAGNLLIVDAYGPWNKEAALEYEKNVQNEIFAVKKLFENWSMMVCVHGMGIYTPDSIPI